MGVLHKTMIIITSDHGEEFLEHGAFGHVGRQFVTHMYEELLRVPLIIINFSENVMGKDLLRKVVSVEWLQIDLLPTLCGIMNVSKPRNVDGIDIFSTIMKGTNIDMLRNHRVMISEASLMNYGRGFKYIDVNEQVIISVRKYPWKLIKYDLFKEELYNIEDDPYERNNLIRSSSSDDVVEDLRKIAIKRLRRIRREFLRSKIVSKLKFKQS